MQENHESNNPPLSFSYPARILVVVCLLLMLGGFYLAIENEVFPSGFYPLIVLLVPGMGMALVVFTLGCIAFKVFGVPVFRSPPKPDSRELE